MRVLRTAVVCAVFVGLLVGASWGSATYKWEYLPASGGDYFLDVIVKPDGTKTGPVKIEEDVYRWSTDGTEDDFWNPGTAVWPSGIYLYRYTVTDVSLAGNITEWGFTEPFDNPEILAINQPPPPAGQSWSHTGDGETTPVWWKADAGSFVNVTLDHFGIIAWGPPHALYDAAAKSSLATADSPQKVSGPTPEPTSGLLLVVSGVGLYGFLRRRRE
jgi:hypothetical protein